jgi:meso-butanediol dehydrogenase / (S,S)-butanediol dehydrogenase / diacetyl reductase
VKGLEGKRVVVTGGTSGIGEATSRRFIAEGAHVAALALGEDEVATAAERIPGVRAIRCDVSERAQVDAAFEEIGAVDVLIANAGISIRKPFLEIDPADWQRVLDVNLTGVFHCAQAAARRMAAGSGGVILMTASTNGLTGHELYADYNASKAGVIALTKALNEEGVPCSCVAPGTLRTPNNEKAMPRADPNKWVPLEQVAEAIAFLCDPRSAGIGGAVITLPSH